MRSTSKGRAVTTRRKRTAKSLSTGALLPGAGVPMAFRIASPVTPSPVRAIRGSGPGGWTYVVDAPRQLPHGRLRADAIVRMFLAGRNPRSFARTYGIPARAVEQVIREANAGAKWWRRAR